MVHASLISFIPRLLTLSLLCTLPLGNDCLPFRGALPLKQPIGNTTVIIQPKVNPDLPFSDWLWQYLRAGLNYLEASGKNYPPSFRHPGNVAFGALGLTAAAIDDVRQRYDFLSGVDNVEVFSNEQLYEKVARLYADLLLRHYLHIDYTKTPPPVVFSCLQKAWFLGPGAYQRGESVILSRQRKTEAFIAKINFTALASPALRLTQLP